MEGVEARLPGYRVEVMALLQEILDDLNEIAAQPAEDGADEIKKDDSGDVEHDHKHKKSDDKCVPDSGVSASASASVGEPEKIPSELSSARQALDYFTHPSNRRQSSSPSSSCSARRSIWSYEQGRSGTSSNASSEALSGVDVDSATGNRSLSTRLDEAYQEDDEEYSGQPEWLTDETVQTGEFINGRFVLRG